MKTYFLMFFVETYQNNYVLLSKLENRNEMPRYRMLFCPVFYGTVPDRIKWPNFDKIPDRTNVHSGPVPDTGFGYFIRFRGQL